MVSAGAAALSDHPEIVERVRIGIRLLKALGHRVPATAEEELRLRVQHLPLSIDAARQSIDGSRQ